MRYEVVAALPEHIHALVPRQSDIDELAACAGITPLDAMLQGMWDSDEVLAGLADGKVFCIAGVAKIRQTGITASAPWMVASEDLKKHARWFLKQARPLVRRWAYDHRWLLNYVDARNVDAIRWLQWLGFRFHEAVPYGVEGRPFYLFDMEG